MLTPATSDRPATTRKAVAFCCDANYLPYALFAASQIAALHPDRDFDICLCHTGPLPVPDSVAGLGLRILRIDTGALFEGFGVDTRRTTAMYTRLALAEALAPEYDRILYLDSDIFVQGGNLGLLMDADLNGHPVAAVRDNIQWRTPTRMPPEFRSAGLPNAAYLNSGVLLIDVAAWRDQDILPKAIEIGRKGPLLRHDQTLLNLVLHRNWAELSPVWNWQYSAQARLFEPVLDVHVVHFIGPRKPWTDPDGALPPRFAKGLSAFLAAHLPDHPPLRRAGPPGLDRKRMRKMLWRHLWNLNRTQRYLARFPGDITIHPQRTA